MKSFQERLMKDYDVKQKLVNGRMKNVYVYKGKYAAWNATGSDLKRYRRIHLNLGMLSALLLLLAAFARTPLNAWKFTGGLTLLSFVPEAVLVFQAARVFFSEEKMILRDCTAMHRAILWCSVIYTVLQAANLIAGGVYLALYGVAAKAVGVLLLYAASAFLAALLYPAQSRLGYHERE